MLLRIGIALTICGVAGFSCVVSAEKAPYRKNLRSDTALFRFERNGKAGFIDAKGKIVIPAKFDTGWFAEEDFVDGLSPARDKHRWGFIDVHGDWVIPPTYWRVHYFSEGLASVETFDRLHRFYISRQGATVIDLPGDVGDAGRFSEGLAAVRLNGSWSAGKTGYIDKTGRIVIPYQFAYAGPFQEGRAAVVLDGQCYVQAREGIGAFTPPSVRAATDCGDIPESIRLRCDEGYIDRNGKFLFRFDSVRDFSEGVAAVERAGKWGFIGTEGAFEIPAQFEEARSFSGGLAAVKQTGKWGYIDRHGVFVINPRFNWAERFSDGMALTSMGYINRSGRVVAIEKNGTAFVQGLAHVSLSDDQMGYIDHEGKVVFRYRPQKTHSALSPY